MINWPRSAAGGGGVVGGGGVIVRRSWRAAHCESESDDLMYFQPKKREGHLPCTFQADTSDVDDAVLAIIAEADERHELIDCSHGSEYNTAKGKITALMSTLTLVWRRVGRCSAAVRCYTGRPLCFPSRNKSDCNTVSRVILGRSPDTAIDEQLVLADMARLERYHSNIPHHSTSLHLPDAQVSVPDRVSMLLRCGSVPIPFAASIRTGLRSLMTTASTSMSPLALTEASPAAVNDVHSPTEVIEADTQLTARYKPYRVVARGNPIDWVTQLELQSARQLGASCPLQPRVLVLYGSLRKVSYSRCLAYEFARILDSLGADVRVFNPTELPMKDEDNVGHPKVVELRTLCEWSTAHVWVSPEQHGAITGVLKNQIDWIPLELGSVRPTQGKCLAVAQANGGSQSFNAVNTLRLLGRWMRMFTVPNQSSVPKAWTEFDLDGRMKPSSYRERVVDVAEELYRFSLLLAPHSAMLVDRYSEREEKRAKGRLLSQAEKEKELQTLKTNVLPQE